MIDDLPTEFVQFLADFNLGQYWRSHETLEAAWRQTRSRFYHGLILFASAYVHLERRNPKGILAQLQKSMGALAPFRPHYLGLDVEELLAHGETVRARVAAAESAPETWATQLTPPILKPDPSRILGTEMELRIRPKGP